MTKKRILPPDRLAECEAAHALFLARKNELKLSQKKIADEAGMTPAAVNLYFKGINPLNAKFAAVLARLLGVPVEKFSPRLADEIRGMRMAPSADSDHKAGAAEKVMAMLRQHAGKKLDDEAQQKIAAAVADSLVDERPSNVVSADFSGLKVKKDEIFIPQYDIRASMGHGQVPPDYTEVMRNVIVKESVLHEKGVTYSSQSALAMIFGWGQSMEGTINDKDPLIVDRGVNEFVGDGIYVLTWHGHLYIKRLQFFDEDHFWLISDNEKHKDQQARIEDVTIHAKVLLIWNAKKA
ncbi:MULTISPECIES: LexA family transcriptional regulator [Pseudomonas]|uniref:LexA family transcriptional regulator n=1 Tax=Pseudomonas TaxID=286 RepID=UPI0013DEDFD4|nr:MULTISPECIES: LexA family transcriptional regulator [Pseudomonas]MCE0912486.1 LexA family transcriptional regulator [Pseudomonas kurunegalensis]QIG19350.1 helix-turn-helix domain-containing protein [Pseudomonas monteilii]QIG24605.1 helix-turn-helix domain-containing protein [Pseudomonas monteilii]WJR54045.1 LexA family transcriptional regulator [Pseudomonas kurunegalensis]WMM94578.1 LexA family transcriptional regulator [Pseudomonas kurunegalensis]